MQRGKNIPCRHLEFSLYELNYQKGTKGAKSAKGIVPSSWIFGWDELLPYQVCTGIVCQG